MDKKITLTSTQKKLYDGFINRRELQIEWDNILDEQHRNFPCRVRAICFGDNERHTENFIMVEYKNCGRVMYKKLTIHQINSVSEPAKHST
ncbi:MAG: hypothetical protein HAW67_03810 [Endozoicomonadaceae bacterium]|nr:hypothetical protein [Endozoicomonadaceae bacterium]